MNTAPAVPLITREQSASAAVPGGFGRKLVANTFINFAGQAVLMVATFLWTPYIVRSFGDALYGVFILLMTYVAVFTLLELGINTSLVKHLAETIPQARISETNCYLGTATALFSCAATIVAMVSAFGAPYIVRLALNVPAQYFDVAVTGVRIASIAFALQFISQGVASVPIAAHRFDVVNSVSIGTELLRMMLCALVIFAGYRLIGVMCVALLTSFLRLLAFSIAAKRLIPGISLRPRISRTHLSHILHFSKFIFLSRMCSTAVSSADKLLIGHFLPIQFVAFYSVPFQLGQRIWILAGNVTTVVFPAASALSLDATKTRLHNLYLRSSKMVAAIVVAPAILLFAFSYQILSYWINPLFAQRGAWPLRLLALGFMMNGFTVVPGLVSSAVNKPKLQSSFAVANTISNLVLFVLLIPRYGTTGAAAAFLITNLSVWPFYMRAVHRLLGLDVRSLFTKVYCPVAVPSLIILFAALSLRSAVHSLTSLLVYLALLMLANVLLFMLLALDEEERRACSQVIKQWTGRLHSQTRTHGGA